MYNEWFPFVDYGIDLEELNDRAKGMMQQHWKKGKRDKYYRNEGGEYC
jgi:SAM-dependent MidA family methyltransferase